MASPTLEAMTTEQPVWELYPAYFRGIDRVLVEIARKAEFDRRLAKQRTHDRAVDRVCSFVNDQGGAA